jgi:predicted enzyme related to lactoylglutathione lyase
MAKLTLFVLYAKQDRMESMKRFYEKLLGCAFVPEKHGTGPRHFAAKVNGIVLEIYPTAPDMVASKVRLGFKVKSISQAIDEIDPAYVVSDGYNMQDNKATTVMDPSGNKVELWEKL